MPQPRYHDVPYDPDSKGDTSLEIIGRGETSRRSKTYFKDGELAAISGGVAYHVSQLVSSLRQAHAQFYTREIHIENDDGSVTTKTVPEVLDDDEIREQYPVIVKWERFHYEQVGHYPSIGGFSVKHTTVGHQPPSEPSRRHDSAAGADRKTDRGETGSRWR